MQGYIAVTWPQDGHMTRELYHSLFLVLALRDKAGAVFYNLLDLPFQSVVFREYNLYFIMCDWMTECRAMFMYYGDVHLIDVNGTWNELVSLQTRVNVWTSERIIQLFISVKIIQVIENNSCVLRKVKLKIIRLVPNPS